MLGRSCHSPHTLTTCRQDGKCLAAAAVRCNFFAMISAHNCLGVLLNRYRAPEVLLQAAEYNAQIGESTRHCHTMHGVDESVMCGSCFSCSISRSGMCVCLQEAEVYVSIHLWLDCRHVGSGCHNGGVVHTSASISWRQV